MHLTLNAAALSLARNIAYNVCKLPSNVNDIVGESFLDDPLEFLLTCVNIFQTVVKGNKTAARYSVLIHLFVPHAP